MRIDDPRILLYSNWDSIKIQNGKYQEKNDTIIKANNVYVKPFVKNKETVLEDYNTMINNNINQSLAIIYCILDNLNASGIRLKSKRLKIFFNKNKSVLNIDLTSTDICNNIEDILEKAIDNYKTSRDIFIKENKDRVRIHCVLDKYVSNYKLNGSGIYYTLMGERGNYFNIDDKNLLISFVNNLADESEEDIQYSFKVENDKNVGEIIKEFEIRNSKHIIMIDEMNIDLVNEIREIVDNHDNKLSDKKEKILIKELKKEQ